MIDRYVLPLGDVSIAINLAPNVYRPEFRNGYVYNYGMPRDRWSRITHQRVEPRRIYRGNQRAYPQGWQGRHHDRDLYVYAPGVKKGAHPRRPPKTGQQSPSRAKNQGKPTHNVGNAAQRKAPPWTARANVGTPDARRRPGAVNPNLRGPRPGAADPRAKWKQHGGGEQHANKPQSKGRGHKPEAAKGKPGKGKQKGEAPGATPPRPKPRGPGPRMRMPKRQSQSSEGKARQCKRCQGERTGRKPRRQGSQASKAPRQARQGAKRHKPRPRKAKAR